MNSRSQQAVTDAITAAAVLVLGAVLAAAGHLLIGEAATGAWGDLARVLGDVGGPHGPTIDVILGLIACATGLLVLAWWLVAMSLAVAAALLGAAGHPGPARWASSVTPAFMRRLALTVLGISLVAGPAAHAAPEPLDPAWLPSASAPASTAPLAVPTSTAPSSTPSAVSKPTTPPEALPSEPPPSPDPRTTAVPPPSRDAVPEPAWTPSLPTPAGGPLLRTEVRPTAPAGAAVEVRPGDSLWAIVARHLGPGANEIDVAEAWPRWFEANRGVIGGNPDVIRPGQLLRPPVA